MAMGAKGEEIRQIFWIPPRLNPEVVMRQMTQGGNPNQNPNGENSGESNQDGDANNPIEINPGGENPPETQ
jgi:hypothetical protein